ncbi:MAG: hypothetical protein KGI55_03140 [Gammaproteobacteria bacterium]|nr:hypothetical protein [Gammaproteobacteria bacterium]
MDANRERNGSPDSRIASFEGLEVLGRIPVIENERDRRRRRWRRVGFLLVCAVAVLALLAVLAFRVRN